MVTRRQFLAASGASVLASSLSGGNAMAARFNNPIGVQLYAVREELAKDFDGTLARVAAAGYSEIEFAGYFNKTVAEIKATAKAHHLQCVGALHSSSDLEAKGDALIDFAAQLGMSYIACVSPKYAHPELVKDLSWDDRMRATTLDDWKLTAEFFNQLGEKAHKAGLQFAYHNHFAEFHSRGATTFYDELLRLTDPRWVKMEVDCGWVAAAGVQPVDVLKKLHGRVVALHLKDLKTPADPTMPEKVPTVALGQGIIDWPTILRTAQKMGVKHYFVELESPYLEPIFDSLTASAKYLSHLNI